MASPFASAADEAADEPRKSRLSPLAGWLGRKSEVADDALPEMDLVGGVNRALRFAGTTAEAQAEKVNLDPARHALSAIEAALYVIDRVRDIIEQAYEVALSAQDVEDVGGRALLAESYDELRLSINSIIDNADDRAVQLIGKSQRQIDVKLGGKAHYSVSPSRFDVSPKGLDLSPPREAFATFDEITLVLGELDTALQKADRAAANYCRDAQFLIARMRAVESDAAA